MGKYKSKMTKREFALHAGISSRTLARRCQRHREALAIVGCQPYDQYLNSLALIYLCTQYDIPRPACIANTTLELIYSKNDDKQPSHLPVIDKNTGRVYGKLTDVLQYTCQEVYEITDEEGKQTLIPNVPAFIAERDTEKGIFITPIDGFFE